MHFCLEALSQPFASMMRFMDAYLLSASVGCGFVLKAPTVGKQLQFLV
jgi:hypothetical protein